LAATIKAANGTVCELAHGARGSFEVYKDGALVYSKLATNRFPTSDDEVIALL
jgi:selT/selW/selH-like putative selenoprotein